MKKLLAHKATPIVLAALCAAMLVAVLWRVFDVGKRITVASAVRDLGSSRNVDKARTSLELVNDRAYVLDALQGALDEQGGSVAGKECILQTLSMFHQPRVLPRSLESASATTRRAAAWLLHGDAELRERCGEVALEWLRDEKASDRWRAAFVCKELKLAEARPTLLEIAQRDPRNPEELQLFRRALEALQEPRPKELIERLLAMAANDELPADLRSAALDAVDRYPEAPRDRVMDLMIACLEDAGTPANVRQKAALGLKSFKSERAWQALEKTLVSEAGEDLVLQRQCLYALGFTLPLDRLKQLLLDRRVYRHPYYGIRSDVANALALMNVREGITLDIMCDYLVDEDPKDRDHLVRREAYLTLWVLTGTAYGVPQQELFRFQPRPVVDVERVRDALFHFGQNRLPTISPDQMKAVMGIVGDLDLMQKARHTYGQTLKPQILAKWEEDAKKAGPPEETTKPTAVGPQPPKPVSPGAPQPPKEPGGAADEHEEKPADEPKSSGEAEKKPADE
jgi:hypothetical protein